MDFSIEPLSEDALLLRFGDAIDPAINARVHAAAQMLREARLPGVNDIAPAYASVLLRFDPFSCGQETNTLCEAITGTLDPGRRPDDEQKRLIHGHETARLIEIPVCYGDEYGPDLEGVATKTRLSAETVIARHTAAEYSVAMLGFAPGFPYLLGLDATLHVPRRVDPRTRVPAGSVAIGGAQTGIYPRELPGGWNLIGRTPLVLFNPKDEPPALLAPGDRVRFRAIDGDEFVQLAGRRA